MPLRCLLFSPDEETVRTISQVLSELGIEAESCFKAVEAVEKVTIRPFQVVIIDWGSQPEAGFLLNTARERKPADRPLTLAIVSDDASVPTALQAGANSVLRKPLQVSQVRDTLATARDFLRSKAEAPAHFAATAAANAAAAAAANAAASAAEAVSVLLPTEVQSTLRAGEFLQPSGSVPAAAFETESSDVQKSLDQAAAAEIDPLRDLEPTASSVARESNPRPEPAATSADDSGQPRGLSWYLKSRVNPSLPATLPPLEKQDKHDTPDKHEKPETQSVSEQLLGYDQTPSAIQETIAPTHIPESEAEPEAETSPAESMPPRIESLSAARDRKQEAELFAYISGEKSADVEDESKPSRVLPWLKKAAMAIAAAVVVAALYRAPGVQKKLRSAMDFGTRAGRNWLNPQPATPVQAPAAHENFGLAGDEYKLPVAENIPDKNTDPSQIRVLPMVDPTVKQPNNGTPSPDQTAAQAPATPGSVDPALANPALANPAPADSNQAAPGQVANTPTPDGQPQPDQPQQTQPQQTQPPQAQPQQTQAQQPQAQPLQAPQSMPGGTAAQSLTPQAQPPTATVRAASAAADPFRPNVTAVASTPAPAFSRPAVQTTQSGPVTPSVRTVATGVPSSLQSKMAQMTPEASGNKPVEAALPSIEPVNLPEASARALLLQHAEPAYPQSAHGQTGFVVVQLLIGRDGTVEDAKFVQGSLAFARPAIDAVREWHFKPYLMNGRPASTQTQLTLSFKPAQ
jgi:periplasmic protein TonB